MGFGVNLSFLVLLGYFFWNRFLSVEICFTNYYSKKKLMMSYIFSVSDTIAVYPIFKVDFIKFWKFMKNFSSFSGTAFSMEVCPQK